MKPPSIALVLERFDPAAGGLESWTFRLAERLIARGHEVHVVAADFAETGLPVIPHRSVTDHFPSRRAANIEAALRGVGVDIVHDVGFGWSADVFQPQTGSRVLNLQRDVSSMSRYARFRRAISPRFRRWRRDLVATERRQVESARHVIAVSGLVKRELGALYELPDDRVSIVTNGIDTERFAPERRAGLRSEARRKLALGDETVFLSVAHNFRLKGVDTALAALARVDGAGIRLIVAGDGEVATYQAKAARLGVQDRVSFLGRIDDVVSLYAAADVFVHPTFHDACSLATLEALAMGVPVITTAANGAAGCMRSGRHGIVVAGAGDAAALAGAMSQLLDPQRRLAMGDAATQLGPSLSFEANVAGVLAVYDRVLSSRTA